MNTIERISYGAFGFFILIFVYYGMWNFAVPIFLDDAINYDPYWAIGPEHLCWMIAIFVIICSVIITLFGIIHILCAILNKDLFNENGCNIY